MPVTKVRFLGALVALMAAGCDAAEPGASTITGTIDQSTFPSAVEQILVLSDAAAPSSVTVGQDGSFTLTLQEGASYRFSLDAEGNLPLVLRTDGERLQTLVTITGGDASVNIGRVRYWGGSVTSDSTAREQGIPAETPPATETAPTTEGACVDGLVEGTTQPCASGEASVTCASPEDGDGHHGRRRGGHRGPRHEGSEPTTADDPTTDASPDQPIAVPELSLAAGIGCGGCPGM